MLQQTLRGPLRGDAQFQKKCLGKINEVAKEHGRTVLIVSHNMDSILRLCQTTIVLTQGRLDFYGASQEAVSCYASVRSDQSHMIDCRNQTRPSWAHGALRVEKITHGDPTAAPWVMSFGGTLRFRCELAVHRRVESCQLFVAIFSASGVEVAASQCLPLQPAPSANQMKIHCQFDDFRLTPGSYLLNLGVHAGGRMEDFVAEAAKIEVLPTPDSAAQHADAFRGFYVPKSVYRLE